MKMRHFLYFYFSDLVFVFVSFICQYMWIVVFQFCRSVSCLFYDWIKQNLVETLAYICVSFNLLIILGIICVHLFFFLLKNLKSHNLPCMFSMIYLLTCILFCAQICIIALYCAVFLNSLLTKKNMPSNTFYTQMILSFYCVIP